MTSSDKSVFYFGKWLRGNALRIMTNAFLKLKKIPAQMKKRSAIGDAISRVADLTVSGDDDFTEILAEQREMNPTLNFTMGIIDLLTYVGLLR